MIAITVDDERPMLNALTDIVKASPDIKEVYDFSVCSAALEWISGNSADVAFLDINMRGMGGLALAEKITKLRPECKIVFCTGYEEYALRRTGCAGCPFGRNFEYELEVIGKYEPKLLKAVNNIFGDSYEYTRRYKEFAKEINAKTKAEKV